MHTMLISNTRLLKQNTYVEYERKDELEFPRENLQLGVDLGQGRFGKVIQGRALNITGNGKWERVAVKTCRGKVVFKLRT